MFPSESHLWGNPFSPAILFGDCWITGAVDNDSSGWRDAKGGRAKMGYKGVCSLRHGPWSTEASIVYGISGLGISMTAFGWVRRRRTAFPKSHSIFFVCFNKLESFALPGHKITDWHAKPIKQRILQILKEGKCTMKKNYRCWEVVMRLTWGTRSSSVLWIAISLLLKSLLAM